MTEILPSHDSDKELYQKLIDACKHILSEEAFADLKEASDLEEALGLVFTLLIENEVDDPDEFLRNAGVIE